MDQIDGIPVIRYFRRPGGTAVRLALALAAVAMVAAAPQARAGEEPWPRPVPGFVPPAPGEHPRLFFRRADLPALRERAGTPEGKAILARLRILLGNGGEAMPTAYQASTEAYQELSKDLPVGAYTLWHAAGYGLLWQLTQERRYADLGRQCVEKAFAGQRDRDDRYSWVRPGGFLRAGPAVGAIAMAYDLCYDGWDEAFRAQVAQALVTYDGGPTKRDGGGDQTMAVMATTAHMPPFSNHYAGQVGGAAMAMLAVRGDAGADQALVERYLASTERNTITAITGGWGDHGQYAEGDGPGAISTDTAYVPALQAWRVAGGKDFVAGRDDVQWLMLKWAMLTVTGPNPPAFPAQAHKLAEAGLTDPANGWPAFPDRGHYPQNIYSRAGSSGSGLFAQGFGVLPEELEPVLLWTYRHCVCPVTPDYDAVSYPHRAVLAFVNWPIGMRERDPGEVLPRMAVDARWGLFMFRNRWQDADDIVVSALPLGHRGYHQVDGGDVLVWGFGKRLTLPAGSFAGKYTTYAAGPHGGVAATASGSLAVDFSGACGADGLIVVGGKGAGRIKPGGTGPIAASKVTIGGAEVAVITLTKGAHPPVQAVGDRVQVGGQLVAVTATGVEFAPAQ